MSQLRKAERQKAKLRLGVSGPAGSGKSYSALILAKSIASSMDKVAIIDTENGSADLYSHLGDFNVFRLDAPYTPERYIEAIKECEAAGMEVLIIDSVTHEWDGKGGLLESNELLGQTKFKGNNWAAWSVTTPRHQRFLEAITASKIHIITTARSKTDTIQTEDKKIKKVGLKEIQREGFEYELTLNFTLDRDGHYATASKDRTGIFIDRDPFVITEETGKLLKDWAESGVDPAIAEEKRKREEQDRAEKEAEEKKAAALLSLKNKIMIQAKTLGLELENVEADKKKATVEEFIKLKTMLDLKDENLDDISGRLSILITEKQAKDRDDKANAGQA